MKPKLFVAHYTDCGEPETWTFRANDYDHAEERFWDMIDINGGACGVYLLRITRKGLDHKRDNQRTHPMPLGIGEGD